MKLHVETFESDRYEQWDRVVAASSGGSPYSSSSYLNVLAQVTGKRARLIGACDDSGLVGGIGLFLHTERRGLAVRGRYLLYYNGFFINIEKDANRAAVESKTRRVLECLADHLEDEKFASVRIKSRWPIDDVRIFIERDWRVGPVYSYEVDISDMDACSAGMHRNLRRQIRQAETSNIKVAESDDIAMFHEMHARTASEKGFPAYLPQQQMSDWFHRLKDAGMIRLYLAIPDGQAACAGLLVLAGTHPVAHVIAAATAGCDMPNGLNAYLRWQVFAALSADGFLAVDLTDAHEPSVARFKSQFGAKLVLCHEVQLPATWQTYSRMASRLFSGQAKRAIKSLLQRADS